MNTTLVTPIAVLCSFAGAAFAQTGTAPAAAPAAKTTLTTQTTAPRTTGDPRRDTMSRMMKPVTINLTETSLEDIFKFIREFTGADIDVMWQDDRNNSGLDKEATVTISVERATALDLIEKVIDKLPQDTLGQGGATWQMSKGGTLQVGPKERLNKFKRVEIYSIRDLLLDVPEYNNAPDFDLQSVLQSSQGGGGQSPFQDNNDDDIDRRTVQERADELMDIITTLVESEQWVANGGDGGTIRYWQQSFIVNAPDYMHRGLNGYEWWPARATQTRTTNGRRYVSLGVDTATNKIDGFRNTPVTGTTGGGAGGGNSGGGGPAPYGEIGW